MPALGPGKHRVEIRRSLSRRVTEAYDSDVQVDQYGPGDAFYGWADIQVSAANVATEAAGA